MSRAPWFPPLSGDNPFETSLTPPRLRLLGLSASSPQGQFFLAKHHKAIQHAYFTALQQHALGIAPRVDMTRYLPNREGVVHVTVMGKEVLMAVEVNPRVAVSVSREEEMEIPVELLLVTEPVIRTDGNNNDYYGDGGRGDLFGDDRYASLEVQSAPFPQSAIKRVLYGHPPEESPGPVAFNWWWVNPWRGHGVSWDGNGNIFIQGDWIDTNRDVVAAWIYLSRLIYVTENGRVYSQPPRSPVESPPEFTADLLLISGFDLSINSGTRPYIAPNGRKAIFHRNDEYITLTMLAVDSVTMASTENTTLTDVEVVGTFDRAYQSGDDEYSSPGSGSGSQTAEKIIGFAFTGVEEGSGDVYAVYKVRISVEWSIEELNERTLVFEDTVGDGGGDLYAHTITKTETVTETQTLVYPNGTEHVILDYTTTETFDKNQYNTVGSPQTSHPEAAGETKTSSENLVVTASGENIIGTPAFDHFHKTPFTGDFDEDYTFTMEYDDDGNGTDSESTTTNESTLTISDRTHEFHGVGVGVAEGLTDTEWAPLSLAYDEFLFVLYIRATWLPLERINTNRQGSTGEYKLNIQEFTRMFPSPHDTDNIGAGRVHLVSNWYTNNMRSDGVNDRDQYVKVYTPGTGVIDYTVAVPDTKYAEGDIDADFSVY